MDGGHGGQFVYKFDWGNDFQRFVYFYSQTLPSILKRAWFIPSIYFRQDFANGPRSMECRCDAEMLCEDYFELLGVCDNERGLAESKCSYQKTTGMCTVVSNDGYAEKMF